MNSMLQSSSSTALSRPSSTSLLTPPSSPQWLPFVLTSIVILMCATSVQTRWCTRLLIYDTVRPFVENTVCNESYQEACGFLSNENCTRYKQTPCTKEYNKTLMQYKIIEKCCPGFKLDPINNVTCISNGTEEEYDGRAEFHGSKKWFSKDVYIIVMSALLSILVVIIVISVGVYIRTQKYLGRNTCCENCKNRLLKHIRSSSKSKGQAQPLEMEVTQNMIPRSNYNAQSTDLC